MGKKQSLSPEQDMAANPAENVWVQANAGTGKTSVLVQRLLRILFRSDGACTNGILCLTYTNAAAGEMRNRILAQLRAWAMADDSTLTELLKGITINLEPTAADLARARAIFFKYIDNPDILKIKTIHGFCEEILHRFPLEAGLSPSWQLVSDTAQKILLRDSFDKLINNAPKNNRTSDAFSHIVGRVSEYQLDDLMQELSRQYKHFFGIKNIDNYRQYFIDTTKEFLNLNSARLMPPQADLIQNIIQLAEDEQKTRKTPAAFLDKIINLSKKYIDKSIDFDEYKFAYLTKDFSRIKEIAKRDYLVSEQDRVYSTQQHILNTQIFEDSLALFDLAAAFAQQYASLKSQKNMLDFDDLILYTRRLFSDPNTMGWVLSQLDLSLSHILVDESQDTSPQQWDILRMMAGDFFTEGDTSQTPHSMFVVGDSKQSIYGFQGADPNAFADSRHEIASQITNNLRTIREIPLAQSFRSAAPILRAVDTFFGDRSIIELSHFSNNHHKCFRQDAPGLVEIHPLMAKMESGADTAAYTAAIADKISDLISTNHYSPDDIMVLVQKRRPFAAPLARELKRRNIDVAGSDRIILPTFPAIRDMLNLLRFCLTPSDDYSLCCTLKSPLFRLTEADIFNLCCAKNQRNNSHPSANNDATEIHIIDILGEQFPEIHDTLQTMIQHASCDGPYSFFSRILRTNDIRAELIAAMGDQIIDPLEEFLTITLAYERTQPGTLRHFLKWFVTSSSEIKRDMDQSHGVRIVTVHGSKGLEAPIVFLVDTISMPDAENFLEIPAPHHTNTADCPPWIWTPRTINTQHRQAAADADNQKKLEEYYRLLYVAMTRARDRLYIYGYTANKNPPLNAWHTRLYDVLGHMADANGIIRITNDNMPA